MSSFLCDIVSPAPLPPRIFFFFFLLSGLCCPIACSLLGGRIPSHNSGYKITRLCPSLCWFCYYFVSPSVLPDCLPYRGVTLPSHSTPLHFTRSLPSTPPLRLGLRSIPSTNPTLRPLFPLPPSYLPPPSRCRPAPTTAETPSLPAAEWPAHRGPELVASQYTA